MEETLSNKSKLWALMLIDADFDDAGLSMAAARVYVHLCRRADKAHVAWPGIDSIAETVRANRKTVITAIKELEQRGFLRVSRTWGSRSNYEILPKHHWKACPKMDQSEEGTSPLEGPVPRTDQYVQRTGPKEEPIPVTDGTSPPEGPPPVRFRERKDNHRRITNKKERITTTINSHESKKPTGASPSSCVSLSFSSDKREAAASALGEEVDGRIATVTGGDHATSKPEGRPRGERTGASPPDIVLAHELGEEFGLSSRQRQAVAQYCESHGKAYVVGKAEIVRSAPRKNAAGALLTALREDWQPAVSNAPIRPGTDDRLARYDELAERMGWQW